jgi:hypothetical protein
VWLYLDVLVTYIDLHAAHRKVSDCTYIEIAFYCSVCIPCIKRCLNLPNFAKLVFRPLISSIFFHILYKTTYLSPSLTFYEKIRENLTKYDHFSEYYEFKNLWLRYDTNLTYYEFHICLTIRFDTTFKKTITPTLSLVPWNQLRWNLCDWLSRRPKSGRSWVLSSVYFPSGRHVSS